MYMPVSIRFLPFVLVASFPVFSYDSLEIMQPFVKVHALPGDTHPFLILAEQGRRFGIVHATATWCKVTLEDTVGWVRKRYARPWPAPRNDSTIAQDDPPRRVTEPAITRRPATTAHEVRAGPPVRRNVHTTDIVHDHISRTVPGGTRADRDTTAKLSVDWAAGWYAPRADSADEHTTVDTTIARTSAVAPETALVVRKPVRIMDRPDTAARTLQTVVPGTRVAVLSANNEWCRVLHDGVDGWVRSDYLHFEGLSLCGGVGLIALPVLLSLVIAAALLVRRARSRSASPVAAAALRAVSQTVLVVRKRPGFVTHCITGKLTTFESCLREVGMRISIASTLDGVRDALKHGAPDIILVDYEFSPDIHIAFAQLLATAEHAGQRCPLLIFYNVASAALADLGQQLPTARLLGTSATDRDLFAPITPRIAAPPHADSAPADEAASALEGTLAEGGMAEILQFIEIGGKTGRLTVNNGAPTAMVYFSDGMIVDAATAGAAGKDAVLQMLDMEHGVFRFVQQPVQPCGVRPLPTLQVLMEWATQRDEAQRTA